MRKIYALLLLSFFLISGCVAQSVPPTGQATKSPDAVVYVDVDNNGIMTEADRRMTVAADEFGNYEIRVTDPGAGVIIPASSRIRAKGEGSISITANGDITVEDSATLQAADSVILSTPGNIKVGLKAKIVGKSSIDIDDGGQITIGDGTMLKAPFIFISNFFGRGPLVGNKVKVQTEDLTLMGASNVLLTNSVVKLATSGYSSIEVNTPGTGYAIDLSGTSFSGKDYVVIGYGKPSNTATTRFRGKPSYISFE